VASDLLNAGLQQAKNLADANSDESISALAALIQKPSLTGEEGAAQAYLASKLEDLGATTELLDIDLPALFERYPDVAQYPTHWEHDLILGYESRPTIESLRASGLESVLNYNNRPNVVARWPGEGNGRSLILNGHIDTVTIEPGSSWTRNPFGAEIENDRMFGRGASDMKGGLMAAILAMKYLREAGVKLAGDVIYQSVVNEEHSGNGTLDLVRRGITADGAIVLEPTDNRVYLSHPGGLYWQVTVPGIQRSPGSRWENGRKVGVSAIEKLPSVISLMMDMEISINSRNAKELATTNTPPMSLVFGKLTSGYYETVTAGEAVLRGSAYFPHPMGTVDEMIQRFRNCIDDANSQDSFLSENPSLIEFLHHDDPTHQADTAGIASHMESLLPAPLHSCGEKAGAFACDMRHLVNRGHIPTIVFGPGAISQAHKPDEYIQISEFLESIHYLINFIGTWCNMEKSTMD
jgi:acetylornithine deacetylase